MSRFSYDQTTSPKMTVLHSMSSIGTVRSVSACRWILPAPRRNLERSFSLVLHPTGHIKPSRIEDHSLSTKVGTPWCSLSLLLTSEIVRPQSFYAANSLDCCVVAHHGSQNTPVCGPCVSDLARRTRSDPSSTSDCLEALVLSLKDLILTAEWLPQKMSSIDKES